MASTPIGGLRVDLSLNSAAFIRDIAKTNQAIATNTKAMQGHLTRLQATANKVGTAFGAWLTFRTVRRVVNFLDQSIELAGKLDNELGRSARAFEMQGAAMKNAFQLGLAQGFLDTMKVGGAQAREQMVLLAKAGLIAGQVLKAGFTVIVDIFTILIPEAINLSLEAINRAIMGLNKLLEWGQAFDNIFGLNKDYGQVPLIPTIDVANIESAASAFFNLSSAESLVADASKLAADGQKTLGDSVRKTSDDIIKQLDAMDALRQKQAEAAIQTTQNWLKVADTVGQALGTLFKDNKAVAIAQAVINTAQAITEAMKLPFPINWAQVAAVTALGAAQIATIASSEPGTSKAIKKGGGSGASAPAKAGSASKGGGGGGGSLRQAVNINVTGESFGPEHFRRLVSGLNAVIADGATLKVQ
jgi:hypothetical protein